MFIATSFIVAKYWKQPKYPHAGEIISCDILKKWYITQHLQRKELMQQHGRRMAEMLREKSQTKILHTVWFHSNKVQEQPQTNK